MLSRVPLILAVSLMLCSCGSIDPTDKGSTPPVPIAELAKRSGFSVFDFPRDVFQPGTIVQIKPDGTIVRTPAGTLEGCQKSSGGGESKGISLTIKRGTGLAGDSEAFVKQGASVNLETLEQILPVRFGLTAKAATHVVMKVPGTKSEYLGSIQIEDWLNSYWNNLSEACRNALTDPEKAILDEVIAADEGFKLSFLSSNLQKIDLSTTAMANLISMGANLVGARVESNELTFKTSLPFWYTLYRSCRHFDPGRLNEEGYLRCVRKIPNTQHVTEAVQEMKHLYRILLENITARDPSSEQLKTMDGLSGFILAIDETNGHALYYKGEMQRLQGRRDRNSAGYLGSHDHFFKYLNNLEKGAIRRKTPMGCEKEETGYCSERTAWIKNLLAQDFYRAALLKVEDKQQGDFCVALKYAKSAQTLFPPIGFRDPLQGPPTEDLIKDLRTRLGESQANVCLQETQRSDAGLTLQPERLNSVVLPDQCRRDGSFLKQRAEVVFPTWVAILKSLRQKRNSYDLQNLLEVNGRPLVGQTGKDLVDEASFTIKCLEGEGALRLNSTGARGMWWGQSFDNLKIEYTEKFEDRWK